jgi:hypothetical protein
MYSRGKGLTFAPSTQVSSLARICTFPARKRISASFCGSRGDKTTTTTPFSHVYVRIGGFALGHVQITPLLICMKEERHVLIDMCEEFQFGQEFTVDHFNFILISINPIEW